MRKYLIIIIVVLTSLRVAQAQRVSAQSFIQQTVMGLQKGYGMRVQANSGWGVGILFQSNGKLSLENGKGNYPFYGVEALIPLTKCGNIKLFFSPKIGFANTNFLVIIPEVETEIEISSRFSAGITAGMRSRESSAGLKLIINLK